MLFQIGFITQSFGAKTALEFFLVPAVSVAQEGGWIEVGLVTVFALVKPRSLVKPLMMSHVSVNSEGFAALFTLVRFLSCVNSHVHLESSFAGQCFVANVANCRFLCRTII